MLPDWAEIGALIIASAAFLKVFLPQKNKNEEVNLDVAATIGVLFERISQLEIKLEAATINLDQARAEIRELQKLEVYLEGVLREREQAIDILKAQLAAARDRIKHLEDVCKRAGLNGDEIV